MFSFLSRYRKSCIFLLFLVLSLHAQKSEEVEIVNYFAKVFIAPSENSSFIGLAQRGERYEVIIRNETWVRIKFKNVVGWVYSSQVGPVGSSQLASETAEPAKQNTLSGTDSNKGVATTESNANTSRQKKPEPPLSGEPLRNSSSRSNESRSQNKPQNQPQQEDKPRNWFSKKSLPELPSSTPVFDDDTLELFFKVTFGPAKVLSYLAPEAPLLGIAWKSDLFPLIGEGTSWCKITYKDSVGWIEHKYGKVVSSTDASSFGGDLTFLFASAAIILAIVVMVALIALWGGKRTLVASDMKKNVLIIAKVSKTVQYTLTSTSISLNRCFTEIGFNVSVAKDNQSLRKILAQEPPDIVLIDWDFDKNILPSFERLFATLPGSEKILCIVYNIPDSSVMLPSRILPNIHYLSSTFSDRDIFKIVTPLIVNENKRNVQMSSQSAALEGDIENGNLTEVLQFIEIGKKSGCLLVETDSPFGLIYFTEGRIVYATIANQILGKEAIFAILDLKNGKFRFISNKRPRVTNINYSTFEILMEWTKAADEAYGN